MRPVTLEGFRTALLESVDDFLREISMEKAIEIQKGNDKTLSPLIDELRSTIRKPETSIFLFISIKDFIKYRLGGFSGWFPLCSECQLKAKIKLVLKEEQFSLRALATKELSEKNTTILQKENEIDELKKTISIHQPGGKEKEEMSSDDLQEKVVINPNSKEIKPYVDFQEKKFESLKKINTGLENDFQQLKTTLAQKEAEMALIIKERDELQNRVGILTIEVESKNQRIEELERAPAQQPVIQVQAHVKRKAARPPERLTGGVFGMGPN